MPSSLHPFEVALADAWPPATWWDLRVLVAVSGGSDSTALLRALRALAPSARGDLAGPGGLLAAHFNHRLRGEESDADEAFVLQTCQQVGIVCHVGRAERLALDSHGGEGLESLARRDRYDFLLRTAADLGARYVVTAHTADDQAETILHRVLRGTGIAGLAGIPRARRLGEAVTLLRPLLGVRRAEVLAYLRDLGQPYRDDSSNADVRLTRNRLRHRWLPRIARQFNPNVVEALLRLGSLAGEVQSIVDELVERLLDDSSREPAPGTVRLAVAPLAGQPRYVIREALVALWRRQGWPRQSMGLVEWDALAAMVLEPAAAKRVFPGGVQAEREEEHLVLAEPEVSGPSSPS